MIELKRDPETGEVVAYENGVPVGPVTTMGDMVDGDDDPEETGSVGGGHG